MPALRFVFPHAPVRPVTINNGYQMRAWYDIIGIDRRSAEDFKGIGESAEVHRRADPSRARARHRQRPHRCSPASRRAAPWRCTSARAIPNKFAGVIALSCYLPLAGELASARNAANQAHADFHGAWHAGSGGALPLGENRAGCWRARAIQSNGTPIRCRIRCASRKSRICAPG